jgi:hypothetical protein
MASPDPIYKPLASGMGETPWEIACPTNSELFHHRRQSARCKAKLLCGLERPRLQLEFDRRLLHATENSLEFDPNVHARIVNELEVLALADSLRSLYQIEFGSLLN